MLTRETALTLSEVVVGAGLGGGKHLGMSFSDCLGCKPRNTIIFSCKSEVRPLLLRCLFSAIVHHVLNPRGVAGTPGCMQDASHAHGGMLLKVAFMLLGVKEGILWKRGRDNGQFLLRKFLLSEREGCLKYFTKQDVSMVVNSHLNPPPRAAASWRCFYFLHMFLRLPCSSQAGDDNRNMSLRRGVPFLLSG